MIDKIEVVNLDAFVAKMGERYPAAVRKGTSEGVKQYVDVLGEDLRANTPHKTGHAQASIYSKMKSELTGVVGYDKHEAWYVAFWVYGSRPHPIIPRGRKGNRDTRRLGAYLRRHGHQMSAAGIDALSGAYRQSNWLAINSRSSLPKAISINGSARSWVNHPGIKAKHLLTRRLEATREQANVILKSAITIEIQGADH